MRRAWLIPLFAVAATRLPAQWQATLDAGATHLRQTGIPESNVATVGGTVDALGDRAWLRSSALAARSGNDGWTAQAVALASIFGPLGPAKWELSGVLSGFGQTNAGSTGTAEAMARVHLGLASRGIAFGAGGGVLSDSASRRGIYRAQATAWQAGVSNRVVGDVTLVGTSGRTGPLARGGAPASYVDASAIWRVERGGVETGVTIGGRAAFRGVSNDGWGSVDAGVWVAPNLALVAAAGRSLEDAARGIPRTRYVSLSLRIAARPHASVLGVARPAGPTVAVTRAGVQVRADGASRVEVMGDFTDWMAVPLERSGGTWRLDRTVAPGLHRIAIRVDGAAWIAPPNLPHATDDLGGVVGLISVP